MRLVRFGLALIALASVASAQPALQLGEPVERALTASDAHAYPLDLPAGQFVLGAADQLTVDVVVTLTGPDGETLQVFDQPARGPEPFQFITETAGAYTLTVTPFRGNEGHYTMRLDRTEPVASTPAGTVDQFFAALDRDDSPGAVVGVLTHGAVVFQKSYGMASLTHGAPFTVETPSNIASTSKQFTAFAVALLADRGALSLDDDVRQHIPELPDFGETVTLRHLLTHTSGYREYLTALAMAGLAVEDDHIDRDDVVGVVVRQPALQNAPGAEWNYNNTGYGLLALVVERVAGVPFQDWMRAEVFEPLGMDRTVVRTDPAQVVPGRAMGYVPADDGGWKEATDLGGAMGDGFIYTTAGDLLRWMDTYRTASLGGPDVLRQMTTKAVLATGDTTRYGLGLFLGEHRGLRVVEHGGADAAHRADFVYYPEIESGVIVLTNSPTVPASAQAVAEVFFADAFEPEDTPEAEPTPPTAEVEPVAFEPATFDAFAGRYELDGPPGYTVRFRRDGERYLMQVIGQRETEIVPVGPARFSTRRGSLEISFHPSPDGSVETLTLHQGRDLEAFRIPTEPEPIVLSDYVGRYYSDELGTVYTVRIEGDGLVLTHRRMDAPIPLLHSADGRFKGTYPIQGLAFDRGPDGAVTGFAASSGRTRGVRFDKMD
ncbi:serine hydrolase [Rubrivirga sp. IMCC43871]|uniref:serine hydrolase n=1 Tax=Rubrivirga sp. IMCC43871 TaxID=3391575 RepID=UPI00398FCF88